MPRFLQVFCRLATLRWLGVLFCALAMMLGAVSTASALEPAQPKTRFWGFDSAEHNSAGLFRAATPRTHLENRSCSAEAASGSLLAARAGAQAAKIGPKIAKQMEPRGWTQEGIQEAIKSGKQVWAVNKATGNAATRYVRFR